MKTDIKSRRLQILQTDINSLYHERPSIPSQRRIERCPNEAPHPKRTKHQTRCKRVVHAPLQSCSIKDVRRISPQPEYRAKPLQNTTELTSTKQPYKP
ncbi:hypothetical protein M758_4G129400 [Ceratodon purpureus]|nr:hypothetical protein M758_4G129400 [Ceratodon purpureus]